MEAGAGAHLDPKSGLAFFKIGLESFRVLSRGLCGLGGEAVRPGLMIFIEEEIAIVV